MLYLSSYYRFYNKDNVRITYNFSLALYGSHSVCRGHLHLLLLLSSWCAKPETALCEWRVQTQQVESDYNKHFSLLPHLPAPNTRVLLEQAFTSASMPALLDLRPLTSFKIRARAQVSSCLSLLSRLGVEQRLSFCSKDLFQGKKWKWID